MNQRQADRWVRRIAAGTILNEWEQDQWRFTESNTGKPFSDADQKRIEKAFVKLMRRLRK